MAWIKKSCLVCGRPTWRRVYWDDSRPAPLCKFCREVVAEADLRRFRAISNICDQRCESCDCLMVAYRDPAGIGAACPTCDSDWLRRLAGMERLFRSISNIRHK